MRPLIDDFYLDNTLIIMACEYAKQQTLSRSLQTLMRKEETKTKYKAREKEEKGAIVHKADNQLTRD
jgi:hypothetical protein